MEDKLFTGVYPPSPPPNVDESFPLLRRKIQTAPSPSSSQSSIPGRLERQPYSSRLEQAHRELNTLPDIMAPSSRETSPGAERRIEVRKIAFGSIIRRDVWAGDVVKPLCTRVGVPNGWDATGQPKRWNRGMTPPLVDTDEQWLAWEAEFVDDVDLEDTSKPAEETQLEACSNTNAAILKLDIVQSSQTMPTVSLEQDRLVAPPRSQEQSLLGFKAFKKLPDTKLSVHHSGLAASHSSVDEIFVPSSQIRTEPRPSEEQAVHHLPSFEIISSNAVGRNKLQPATRRPFSPSDYQSNQPQLPIAPASPFVKVDANKHDVGYSNAPLTLRLSELLDIPESEQSHAEEPSFDGIVTATQAPPAAPLLNLNDIALGSQRSSSEVRTPSPPIHFPQVVDSSQTSVLVEGTSGASSFTPTAFTHQTLLVVQPDNDLEHHPLTKDAIASLLDPQSALREEFSTALENAYNGKVVCTDVATHLVSGHRSTSASTTDVLDVDESSLAQSTSTDVMRPDPEIEELSFSGAITSTQQALNEQDHVNPPMRPNEGLMQAYRSPPSSASIPLTPISHRKSPPGSHKKVVYVSSSPSTPNYSLNRPREEYEDPPSPTGLFAQLKRARMIQSPSTPVQQTALGTHDEASLQTPPTSERQPFLSELLKSTEGDKLPPTTNFLVTPQGTPVQRSKDRLLAYASPFTTPNKQIHKVASGDITVQNTPLGPDSPYSSPPSSIPRMASALDSPPSTKKPRISRMNTLTSPTKGFTQSGLVPQSSGLLGMDYNSQYMIDDNVDAVSKFLEEDVNWKDTSY